jgi:hypothetical protein
MKPSLSYIALTILGLGAQHAEGTVRCLDNSGHPVDWYLVYKLNDGAEYAYYDSTSDATILTPSTIQSVGAGNNSCIERTTAQIYDNKETINWALYNDENAINGVTNYTCGHSKGMVAFTKDGSSDANDDTSSSVTGFWMLHSAPKFPNISLDSYEFASNALLYGQNFFCASLDGVEAFDNAAKQLRYVTPWVFASNNLNSDTSSLSNWNDLLDALHGDTHWYNEYGLQREYLYIGMLYLIIVLNLAVHMYAFFYAISKGKSSVAAGVNKAFQAIGVYSLSDILFCDTEPDQCLTLWKSVGVGLVIIGILLYSMANECIIWYKTRHRSSTLTQQEPRKSIQKHKYHSLNKT